MKFSKLNRNLAQRVWDIAGITIIQLLAAFSEKLTSVQHTAKQYHEGKGTPCIHHDEEDSTSRSSVSQEVINKINFHRSFNFFFYGGTDICNCHISI
jgi:hypothetical protein